MPDKKGSASKIKMASLDDLFAIGASEDDGAERIKDVEILELQPFKNHPFRVLDDEKMQETVESIQKYGVLNPILVRPVEPQVYEIVAGHRRKRACEILGIEKVPCIIRELSEEETTIIVYLNKFKFTAVRAGILSAAISRVTAVDHLINVLHFTVTRVHSIFYFFIIVSKNLL